MAKSQKVNEDQIEKICNTALVGKAVPVMETPKIWRVAEACIAAGQGDDEAVAAVRRYVETVAVNL